MTDLDRELTMPAGEVLRDIRDSGKAARNGRTVRQQVLVLYLQNSALTSGVAAWAFYDGTGRASSETGDQPVPPFETGLAALEAGWRLLTISPLRPYAPGTEYTPAFMRFECVFERLVVLD